VIKLKEDERASYGGNTFYLEILKVLGKSRHR
jgi:hypothetical protein